MDIHPRLRSLSPNSFGIWQGKEGWDYVMANSAKALKTMSIPSPDLALVSK